jgi:hypothetical protein
MVKTKEDSMFIFTLRPLAGFAYHAPSVYKVPSRIAEKFLSANAAFEIDEHTFKKYELHQPHDLYTVAETLKKGNGPTRTASRG